MTLKIEVDVPFEVVNGGHAALYLSSALSAIGYTPTLSNVAAVNHGNNVSTAADASGMTATEARTQAETSGAAPRERGKPAAGRARRTKEEIAEDEAADRTDAGNASSGANAGSGASAETSPPAGSPSPSSSGATTASPGEEKAQISTGDERIGPEDSAEDQAQDAADEKAETESKRDPVNPLTHNDVKNALGLYVKTYGMAATQEDGPKVIALMFGEGKSKVSDVPDDQDSLRKAIAGINEMLEKNPYGREADL